MNTRHVLFNLKEAKEELDRTIVEIELNNECDREDFRVAMSHLYHHLNTAWNAQDVKEDHAVKCSDKDFNKWRKFPDDEELLLSD